VGRTFLDFCFAPPVLCRALVHNRSKRNAISQLVSESARSAGIRYVRRRINKIN
jgi:hypothetical protein